jgi:hypothetical protein
VSALNHLAARAQSERQISEALVAFYRVATVLVQEILDGGHDVAELEAKGQGLKDEVDRVVSRVRAALPAPGEDVEAAAARFDDTFVAAFNGGQRP